MSLIQLLLIFGSLACLFLYFAYFRTILRDRVFVVLFFLVAMLAVLFPDSTTDVAKQLGVGRGTDLVFYLFILGSFFVAILFYNRLSHIERNQTELIRTLALRFAKNPPEVGREN